MPEQGKTEGSEAEGGEQEASPAQADPAEKKAEQPASSAEEDAGRPAPPPGGIADLIAEALPDVKIVAYQGLSDVIIEIERDDVPKVMPVVKDNPKLDLTYLRCLSGVDHQDEGLEVVYHLLSLEQGHEVEIKTRFPKDDAHVASVTSVWKGANWHERETRDMFGITFDDHPNLVPLLLPDDMLEHHPLLKENGLLEIEEWQGEFLGDAGGADDNGGEAEEA